jgi:hypothetical protein
MVVHCVICVQAFVHSVVVDIHLLIYHSYVYHQEE